MATTKTPAKKAPAKKAAAKKPAARKWTAAPASALAAATAPAAPAKPTQAEQVAQGQRLPFGGAKKLLDAFGEDMVRARLLDGRMQAEIAREVGVSEGALIDWIATTEERSARIREARKLGAAVLEERAQRGLEEAKDAFQLRRAEAVAHHLRWKATRLDPRTFGDKVALGQAQDLPPLPQPAAPSVTVTNNFEMPPAEAYAQMLARRG